MKPRLKVSVLLVTCLASHQRAAVFRAPRVTVSARPTYGSSPQGLIPKRSAGNMPGRVRTGEQWVFRGKE